MAAARGLVPPPRYSESVVARQLLLRTALISKLFVPVKSPISLPLDAANGAQRVFCYTSIFRRTQQTKETMRIMGAMSPLRCILSFIRG